MTRKPNSLVMHYKDILMVRICRGCDTCAFDSVHRADPTVFKEFLGDCGTSRRTDHKSIVFRKIRTLED